MAKTRTARKSAPRAKGKKKSTGSRKKKPALDLKKLRKDIEKAQAILAKRQQKAGKVFEPPTAAQSVLERWSGDIAMLCADPTGGTCGPDMVIS